MAKNESPPRYLAVVNGPDRGCCIPIKDGSVIGRASAQAPLSDPQLGRLHAYLRAEQDHVELHFLPRTAHKSAGQGTSARPLRSRKLLSNQRFQLGQNALQVRSHLRKIPTPPNAFSPQKFFPLLGLLLTALLLWRFVPMLFSRTSTSSSSISLPGFSATGSAMPFFSVVFKLALCVLLIVLAKRLMRRISPPDFSDLLFLSYGGQTYRGSRARTTNANQLLVRVGPGRVLRLVPGGNYRLLGKYAHTQVQLAAIQLHYFAATMLFANGICLNGAAGSSPQALAQGSAKQTDTARTRRYCLHLDYSTQAHHPDCIFLVAHSEHAPLSHTKQQDYLDAQQAALAAAACGLKRWWWPFLAPPAPQWWRQFCALAKREHLPRQLALAQPPPALTQTPNEAGKNGLQVYLGEAASGAIHLDFGHDPHVLIAGTTGAGKSALLRTLVLNLAATYSARELQLLLVDYKGGDAFREFAQLEQVLALLTNLEPAQTQRALDALEFELETRERGGVFTPLVIIVDEYAELICAHPTLAQRLQRIAALGRGLGIHLVIATQHPQGSVSAELLANISGRVILRLLAAQDSTLLLGHAGAAQLPAYPGRALASLRGQEEEFQVALIKDPAQWLRQAAALSQHADESAQDGQEAAEARLPWLPPLPYPLHTAPVAATEKSAWAYLDFPRQRLQLPARLPARLLLLGGAGSGVTTALFAAARQSLAAQARPVLLVSSQPAFANNPAVFHPRARATLAALRKVAPQALVVIDDAELLLAAIDNRLGPNTGMQVLTELAQRLRAGGCLLLGSHRLAQLQSLFAAITVLPGLELSDHVRLQIGSDERNWLTRPGTALFLGTSLLPEPAAAQGWTPGVVRFPSAGANISAETIATWQLWGRDLDKVARTYSPRHRETILGWFGAQARELRFQQRYPLLLVSQSAARAERIAQQLVAASARARTSGREDTRGGYRIGAQSEDWQPGEIRIGSPFAPDSLALPDPQSTPYHPVTIFLDGAGPGLPEEISSYSERGLTASPVALINTEVTPFTFNLPVTTKRAEEATK